MSDSTSLYYTAKKHAVIRFWTGRSTKSTQSAMRYALIHTSLRQYPFTHYDRCVPTEQGDRRGWWAVFSPYDYELLDHKPSYLELKLMEIMRNEQQ